MIQAPEDAAALERDLRDKNAVALGVLAALAGGLVPAFWYLDFLIIREHVWTTVWIRGALTLWSIFLVVMVLRNRAWVARWVHVLGPALTLPVAWSISIMCWLHIGYESEYYAGLNLIVLATGTLLLWPLRVSLPVYLAIWLFHMTPLAIGAIPVTDVRITVNNQFFLLSTMVIIGVSQTARHGLQTRTFLAGRNLERTTTSLEEALGKLKELDRVKSEFFSNITHELRTPLTMILSPVESLLGGDAGALDPPKEKYLRSIRKNALKLLKLINDLLDLSRIEERFMRIRAEPVDLAAHVREIVEFSRPLAQRKDITLEIVTEPVPADVQLDPELMERVFVNLVANALKFTEPGGRVTLKVEPAGDEVLVRVSDTGVGIPPDKLESIFERFSQADASVTRRYGGTGIGLAFAKEIVALHGGRIEVESQVGKGSTFTVRLGRGEGRIDPKVLDRRGKEAAPGDVRRAEDREPREWTRQVTGREDYRYLDIEEATERRVAERGDDRGKHAKVLVVEDNVEILRFIHLQLESNFAVYLAKDGEEGLELCRRERPDVVVTDFMMPRMDGMTMVAEIRADEAIRDVPVVMLTAKSTVDDRLRARKAGADVYLSKPFSPSELKAAIGRLLEKRGREVDRVVWAQARSLETISAGLAHEIRNPLASLKTACFLLAESAGRVAETARTPDLPAGERNATVEKAEARIGRAKVTIENGISRIERILEVVRRYAREGYPATKSPVVFDAAVADVLSLVTPPPDSPVQVEPRLDAGSASVLGIPEELHQVVRNLVQNAVDSVSTQERGGLVRVSTYVDAGHVHLVVADDGPGIPPDDLPRVFAPFFTRKAPGQGMGLGLAITDQIVRTHGGTVEVHSTFGQGATFQVHLPICSPDATDAADLDPSAAPAPAAPDGSTPPGLPDTSRAATVTSPAS